MVFKPLIVGFMIGLVILGLTFLLKKVFKTKIILLLPSILSILSTTYFIYYSLLVVRGFEGAAYLFLVFPIYISAIIAIIYVVKTSKYYLDN